MTEDDGGMALLSLSKLRKTVTGKSGVLQFVGLQGVRYDLTSEQQDDQSLHTYQCMTRNYIICIYVCVCVCVYIYIYTQTYICSIYVCTRTYTYRV